MIVTVLICRRCQTDKGQLLNLFTCFLTLQAGSHQGTNSNREAGGLAI